MSFVLTAYKFAEKRRLAQAQAAREMRKKQREQEKEQRQIRQDEYDAQQSVYQEPERTWKQFMCQVSDKNYVISLCLDTLETLIGDELIETDIIFDDVKCSATLKFLIANRQAQIVVQWLEDSTVENFYLADAEVSQQKNG